MERENLYFLKISGTVTTGKQREFQQTVQFVFNQLSSNCLNHNLTLDVHIPALYHLYSLWNSEDSLHAFRSSHEFELIKGAFQTLGSYKDTMSGRWVDVQLFERQPFRLLTYDLCTTSCFINLHFYWCTDVGHRVRCNGHDWFAHPSLCVRHAAIRSTAGSNADHLKCCNSSRSVAGSRWHGLPG